MKSRMSATGHSRRFGRRLSTSVLPLTTDILSNANFVGKGQ
jgi:hypothetical protein